MKTLDQELADQQEYLGGKKPENKEDTKNKKRIEKKHQHLYAGHQARQSLLC